MYTTNIKENSRDFWEDTEAHVYIAYFYVLGNQYSY